MADVGVEATMEIIDTLTQRVSRKELTSPEALHESLKEELHQLLQRSPVPVQSGLHQICVSLFFLFSIHK